MKTHFFFAGFLFFVFPATVLIANTGNNVAIEYYLFNYRLQVQFNSEDGIVANSHSNDIHETSNIIIVATKVALRNKEA